MFKALNSYVRECGFIGITVLPEDAERLRVVIQPRVPEGQSASVYPPISVCGLPSELDDGLSDAIVNFNEQRLSVKEKLDATLAEMKAEAENAKKQAEADKKKSTKPAAISEKKEAEKIASKAAPKVEVAPVDDLFSSPIFSAITEQSKEVEQAETASAGFDNKDDEEVLDVQSDIDDDSSETDSDATSTSTNHDGNEQATSYAMLSRGE